MLDLIKQTLEPPYNSRDLYSIFVALFLMLLIPLTVIESTKTRDNRSSAAEIDRQSINTLINVKMSSPENNAFLSGPVLVKVQANTQDQPITRISLYLGNKLLATSNNPVSSNTFDSQFTVDTAKEKNGKYTLKAWAYNSLGQKNSTSSLVVNFQNLDTTPPIVSFQTIKDGDYISGGSLLVKTEASDDKGIASVAIYIDSKLKKQFDRIPFNFDLDLSEILPGNHTLSALATDISGNVGKVDIKFYKGVKQITN